MPENNAPDRMPLWLLPQFSEFETLDAATDTESVNGDTEHAPESPQHNGRSHTAAGLLSAAGHNPKPVAETPTRPQNTPISTLAAKNRRRLVRNLVGHVTDELTADISERRRQVEDENEPTPSLAPYTRDEERELGRRIIADHMQRFINGTITAGGQPLTVDEQHDIEKSVYDTLFGLGPIQAIVELPGIEDIFIYGTHCHSVDPDGARTDYGDIADTDDEVIEWISNLAARAPGGGRLFSQMHPHLRLNLEGGIRFTADAWTVPRPEVSIRLHRHKNIVLEDCVNLKTMPSVLARVFECGQRGGMSMVAAGDMGSGKTMHIRAIANSLPLGTRIGTVETERELFLHELPGREGDVISYEILTGGGEIAGSTGKELGSVDLGDLLYSSVRHRLDRVMVGEVAGKEIIHMLKSMQFTKGSLSTTHARTARGAIDRLVTCATEDHTVSERYATRQVMFHINLIFHLEIEFDTDENGKTTKHRFVDEVIYLEPGENGEPAITTVYKGGRGGEGHFGSFPPVMVKQLYAGGFTTDEIPPNTLTWEEAS